MLKYRKGHNFINDNLVEIHSYGINLETRELFLHGAIHDDTDPGVDYRTAFNTIKNIRYLSSLSDSQIFIHHYSIGGECDAGFAIYDAIQNCRCHVTMICHGVIASMGTIITQAADIRLSMPNCYYLLHEGGTSVGDMSFREAKAAMNQDQITLDKMMDIYAEKMQKNGLYKDQPLSKIKKFIEQKFDKKHDWTISAKEALEYSLIDGIIGEGKIGNLDSLFE